MEPESHPIRSSQAEILLSRARAHATPRPERIEAVLSAVGRRVAAGDLGPTIPDPISIASTARWLVGAAAVVGVPLLLAQLPALRSTPSAEAVRISTDSESGPTLNQDAVVQPPMPSPAAAIPIEIGEQPEAPPLRKRSARPITRERLGRPMVEAPMSDGISAEVGLIREASLALSDDVPERALEYLREHESRFPRGVMAAEREVLRAEALCAAGRRVEARNLAQDFARKHSGSPLGKRALAICAGT